MAKKIPGLRRRNNIWHIEKSVLGVRLYESTGTSNLHEAERILARRIDEIRKAYQYGVRPQRTFSMAAKKFEDDNEHLSRIDDYKSHIKKLNPYIGDMSLDKIHMGSLQPFIDDRIRAGIKKKSINLALGVVRRILNLTARLWRDENGLTWLEIPPLIQMLPTNDAKKPYPLTWSEQRILFKELPDHLAAMALFKVNTGTREQEICQLSWEWEVKVPELNSSVFLIPAHLVKNRDDRLVVLNKTARSIIEAQRGKHPEFVFGGGSGEKKKTIHSMNNTAWQRSRIRAAMALIRQDASCESLESCISRNYGNITVHVTCRRNDPNKILLATYTLEEHQQSRAKRGLPILNYHDVKQRGIAQVLRYKAIQRFIDQHWPELSAFSRVRVHDLKHTFGRRLRAAGVPLETRKVLLGHRNNDITTHYSAVELTELIQAVEKVSAQESGKTPALVVLRRKNG